MTRYELAKRIVYNTKNYHFEDRIYELTSPVTCDKIADLFSWNKTPEGFIFWENIYKDKEYKILNTARGMYKFLEKYYFRKEQCFKYIPII